MSFFMSKEWCEPEWLMEPAARKRQHLKKACVNTWKHSGQPSAGTETEHHVAELTHRRVGEDLLDVVLHEGEQCRNDDRDAADDGNETQPAVGDVEPFPKDRVDASDEEDTGNDHGRGVKQRRHGGRARHRVRQPRVKRELAGLADCRDEQGDRRHQQRPTRTRRLKAPRPEWLECRSRSYRGCRLPTGWNQRTGSPYR